MPACPCPICGESFTPVRRSDGRWTKVCSKYCENIRRAGSNADLAAKNAPRQEINRLNVARKHAARRAAVVERVDRQTVFERDQWKCHVCGDNVDKTLSGRDPMGPSIDHLIPISKGGKTCYANVALAHLSCNSRRWVSLPVAG